MRKTSPAVRAYLDALPDDRRAALEAVRRAILANLDPDVEEGIQYGMIGYGIPHRVYPDGYHCDPKQPLPYAALANQKGAMSLYLNFVYGRPEEEAWLRKRWTEAGKKLDMGKSCIRFKKLEDVPLDVVGEAFRRAGVKAYIGHYEAVVKRPAGRKRS